MAAGILVLHSGIVLRGWVAPICPPGQADVLLPLPGLYTSPAPACGLERVSGLVTLLAARCDTGTRARIN